MRGGTSEKVPLALHEDRISRLIILLSSLCSKKKITRNVNQDKQDELHTIHDRINGALCSDIKRHNRVFAFVPARRTRIRIRKKRERGKGRYRKSDMAYSITSPFLLVSLQPALINHRVLLYRDNLMSVAKVKAQKKYTKVLRVFKKKEFKNEKKS